MSTRSVVTKLIIAGSAMGIVATGILVFRQAELPASDPAIQTHGATLPARPNSPRSLQTTIETLPEGGKPRPRTSFPHLADRLQSALNEGHKWVALDAIREARDRKDQTALHVLESVHLPRHPGIAPAVIIAVADVGDHSTDEVRDEAAWTLVEWYRSEEHRDGKDAVGNRAALVKALASLKSPVATRTLGEWVDEDRLPLHLAVIASRGLLKSNDARADAVVRRLEARLAESPNITGLAGALRHELIALVQERK